MCLFFPFRFHIPAISWYFSFSVRLSSLTVITPRSNHVAANGIISCFLWLSNTPSSSQHVVLHLLYSFVLQWIFRLLVFIGYCRCCCSVTHSMSDYLRFHDLQHARLPCPLHLLELSQTPVHLNSDAIQPSRPLVIPFSSCLQSFPASGSFLTSQLFTSVGLGIGTSASVLLMNIQD